MERSNFLPFRLAWATARFVWWSTEEFRKDFLEAAAADLTTGRVVELKLRDPLVVNNLTNQHEFVEVKRWRTGRIMRRAESRLRLAADAHEGDHWFAEAAKR